MLRDFRGDVQKCGSEDAFYRNVAIAGGEILEVWGSGLHENTQDGSECVMIP